MLRMTILLAMGLTCCAPRELNSAEADAALAEAQKVLDHSRAVSDAAGPMADWALIEDKSPITDEPSVQIVTLSQALDGIYGTKRVGLRIRCDEGQLQVSLEWPGRVSKAATWPVTMRFDAEPAENLTARVTVDNMDTGWGGADARKMIRRLSGSKKLAARILTSEGEPMTAEFITAGLEERLPKLEAACPALASAIPPHLLKQ